MGRSRSCRSERPTSHRPWYTQRRSKLARWVRDALVVWGDRTSRSQTLLSSLSLSFLLLREAVVALSLFSSLLLSSLSLSLSSLALALALPVSRSSAAVSGRPEPSAMTWRGIHLYIHPQRTWRGIHLRWSRMSAICCSNTEPHTLSASPSCGGRACSASGAAWTKYAPWKRVRQR